VFSFFGIFREHSLDYFGGCAILMFVPRWYTQHATRSAQCLLILGSPRDARSASMSLSSLRSHPLMSPIRLTRKSIPITATGVRLLNTSQTARKSCRILVTRTIDDYLIQGHCLVARNKVRRKQRTHPTKRPDRRSYFFPHLDEIKNLPIILLGQPSEQNFFWEQLF
jgi:hypothetical protein